MVFLSLVRQILEWYLVLEVYSRIKKLINFKCTAVTHWWLPLFFLLETTRHQLLNCPVILCSYLRLVYTIGSCWANFILICMVHYNPYFIWSWNCVILHRRFIIPEISACLKVLISTFIWNIFLCGIHLMNYNVPWTNVENVGWFHRRATLSTFKNVG
jgi:hypothetical protein